MQTSTLVNITNESSDIIFLRNLEPREVGQGDLMLGAKHHVDIASGRTTTPAAENAEQFGQHHLELEVGDRMFCIWQHESPPGNNRLRFSSDGQWSSPSDGNTIPGIGTISKENHPYRLVIGEDGQISGELLTQATVAPSPLDPAADAQQMDDHAPVSGAWRLNYIYGFLHRDREFEGRTYGMFGGNLLENPWLLQTPNYWGKRAADLPNDHSHDMLGTKIREMIKKAGQSVDITLLFQEPRDGWYLECIAEGLRHLANQGRQVVVRILTGAYLGYWPDTRGLLERILNFAPQIRGSQLRIYAGSFNAFGRSWNHSKIVAVDGRWAMVGGHNQWWPCYLCSAPVHDVSMQLEGPVAAFAHRFCNRLWEHVNYWNDRVYGNYADDYNGRTRQFGKNCLTTIAPTPSPGRGKTPVLAVGRMGALDLNRGNQSDIAFLHALSTAKKSIKLSQQDLLLWRLDPEETISAPLVRAILGDIPVSLVLSSRGATSGGDQGYTTGGSLEDLVYTFKKLTARAAEAARIPLDRAMGLLSRNLRIATIRFSHDTEWPAVRANDLCGQARRARQIANHAKVWIVDDEMFYIGSQNLYWCNNAEYGWIVEGREETAQLLRDYWDPLWSWSSRTAISPTSETIEEDYSQFDTLKMPVFFEP